MVANLPDSILGYLEFTARDAALLAELHPIVEPCFRSIVDDFYSRILGHEDTRRIIQDEAQVERLKRTLVLWLSQLFRGPHDDAYFERRRLIGTRHVQIGLEPAYVYAAMAHIHGHLERAVIAAHADRVDHARLLDELAALGKVLHLDLAIIAGSYHETESRRSTQAALFEQAGLARVGEMAAVVAHEVKNPLAGIRGAIQILETRLGAETEEAGIIRKILARIDTLDGFVNDILVFARPRLPKLEPVPLVPLLAGAASVLREDPRWSRVAVRIEASDVVLHLDAELLAAVFVNLFLNAAQAMKGEGEVHVVVRSIGERCHVTIADQGPGILPELRKKVFEPFVSTKKEGSGLGLAIARRTVEAHAGTIEIECPEGGGTAVHIWLPRGGPRGSGPRAGSGELPR